MPSTQSKVSPAQFSNGFEPLDIIVPQSRTRHERIYDGHMEPILEVGIRNKRIDEAGGPRYL